MTKEEYDKIKKAIEGAEESVVPFPVMDDELAVVGDANETQLNMHDFTMRFKVPIEEDGVRKRVLKTVEYKDVYLTPRQEPKVATAIADIFPYFKKIKGDGSLSEFTEDEVYQLIDSFEQEIFDKMYALVGNFLRIDKELWDFMYAPDVFEAVLKIFNEYHEAVNEADTFFG